MKPVIAFTLGDFNGIGPEVILKSITSEYVNGICSPLLVGSIDVFEFYARLFRMKMVLREVTDMPVLKMKNSIPVFQVRQFHKPRIISGSLSAEAGKYAGDAIMIATEFAGRNLVDGIVTAPASKETLNMGGYKFPGQTEMIARHFGQTEALMMFTAKKMKVGLATRHLPLSRLPRHITYSLILKNIEILDSSLKNDFGVRKPDIAVLGLNPHAGEGGLLGKEEQRSIIPAIRKARAKGIKVYGPFPADAFFGSGIATEYDAILALYHDQGLIPFKMLNFNTGVNVTAGLPVVRTSPDHGTAFEIAGKGIADPSSMIEAVRTAVQIIRNRKRKTA